MLTEKSKVKNYLGISDILNDALFDDLCAGISRFITDFIDRDIEKGTTTEYFDGRETVIVKNYPIISVTSIRHNVGTQAEPNWYMIDPINYVVYKFEGKIVIAGGLVRGLQNIEIVYEAGYLVIPEDIEMVATQLVAKMFETRKAQGKLKEALGGAQIDWKNELTIEQKNILSSYSSLSM